MTSRIARTALGVECIRDYDPRNPEHRQHSSLVRESPTGKKEIIRMFDVIIDKACSGFNFGPSCYSFFLVIIRVFESRREVNFGFIIG